MSPLRIATLIVLAAAGMLGCSHCDTCDDFPMPLGAYAGQGGTSSHLPPSYAPQGGAAPVPTAATQLPPGASSQLPADASGPQLAPSAPPASDASALTPPPLPDSPVEMPAPGADRPSLVPNP